MHISASSQWDEMYFEHQRKGKNGQSCHKCLWSGWDVWPLLPYGHPELNTHFFTASLIILRLVTPTMSQFPWNVTVQLLRQWQWQVSGYQSGKTAACLLVKYTLAWHKWVLFILFICYIILQQFQIKQFRIFRDVDNLTVSILGWCQEINNLVIFLIWGFWADC